MYPGFFGPTRSAPKAKTKSSKRITAQQLALLNKKLPPTPQSDLSFVGAGVPLARNGMLHLTLNPQLGRPLNSMKWGGNRLKLALIEIVEKLVLFKKMVTKL